MKYYILITTLFLAACATNVKAQYNLDKELGQALLDEKNCSQEAFVKAKLQKNILLKDYDIIAETEENSSKISTEDKIRMQSALSDVKTCGNSALQALSSSNIPNAKRFYTIVESHYKLKHEVYEKYINGKTTLYQTQKNLGQAIKYTQEKHIALLEQITSELNQPHYQQRPTWAAWAALAQGMSVISQQYQQQQNQAAYQYNQMRQQNQANRITNTRCNWIGDTLNCTTF